MSSHTRKTPADPNLALRIELMLLKRGMTGADLADAIGRKRASVSHYVTGKVEPPRSIIAKIAKALGCRVEWLMGDELTEEERERERQSLEALVGPLKGLDPEEAAEFLELLEALGGAKEVLQKLRAMRRS